MAAARRWVAGAIAAAVGNKILKRIIGQARPEEGDDDGMPSSHACGAASIFFRSRAGDRQRLAATLWRSRGYS